MIDWRRGSWTGSLNKFVRREVREQMRSNRAARRVRHRLLLRALRTFFAVGSFSRFLIAYALVDLFAVAAELAGAWRYPALLRAWSPHSPDLAITLANISGYLIGAQVGALEDAAFWNEVTDLAARVGSEPVLVLSKQAEARTLRRLLRDASDKPNITIENKPRDQLGPLYIATIHNIDVYGADFTPATAWLFSARALQAIHYAALDRQGTYVKLVFDFGEDIKGPLRASFKQRAIWANTTILELHLPGKQSGLREQT